MSSKILRNLVVYPLMILVVVLQVYFALILVTVPAIAQDKPAAEVEVELPKNQGAVDTRAVLKKPDTNFVTKDAGSKKLYITDRDGNEIEQIPHEDFRDLRYKIMEKIKSKMANSEDSSRLEHMMAEVDNSIFQELKQLKTNKDNNSAWVNVIDDILVPIFLFLTFAGVFGAKYYFAYRTRREQLDLYRLAIEKGQPIPADVFTAPENKGRSWQDEMGRGIKFVLVGLGLALFFQTVGGPWAIGAIFTFIGLGQLGAAYIKKNSQPQ